MENKIFKLIVHEDGETYLIPTSMSDKFYKLWQDFEDVDFYNTFSKYSFIDNEIDLNRIL